MKKIIIIGGKGTAVVIAEQIIDAIQKYNAKLEVLGFAFDDVSNGLEINNLPILCKTTEAYSKYRDYKDIYFIFSLYRSDLIQQRITLRDNLMIPKERFITFTHPTSTIARSARMGFGNIILANVVINPNVLLGSFNTVNSNALIGHDSTMGDSNFYGGHTVVGSNIIIGNGNFFGLNCSIKNFVNIGDFNIIGMAANVIKNTGSNNILIGNPAGVHVK